MGQYNVDKYGLDKKPGWRRGKSLEVFRNQGGEVQIGMITDDPGLETMDVEDAKCFLCAGESELATSVRYTPTKFKKNSFRAICSNDIKVENEPASDDRTIISFDELLGYIGKAFGYIPKIHFMAILKRSVSTASSSRHFLAM